MSVLRRGALPGHFGFAANPRSPVLRERVPPRPHTGLARIDYPFHDKTIVVTRCGRICLGNKKINFSQVFAGQAVGIKEVHDDVWLITFVQYDLGHFDFGEWSLGTAAKSLRPKSVTHVSGTFCYPCLRNGHMKNWSGR